MKTQVGLGWDARQVYAGAGAPPAGNRLILVGQTAVYTDTMVAYGGELDAQAVDFCKWLVGGATSGTVWVSDHTVDLTYWDCGTVPEVQTAVRSALGAAGFTVSASSDTNDTITYPAFDIAIVGKFDSFGQLLADDDARAAQLIDFVNDGGGLILINSNQAGHNDIETAFDVRDWGSWVTLGNELSYLTGATALHPVLFPSGRTVWRKVTHRVGVGVVVDANHGQYAFDGIAVYKQYATYSAHGDA